MIHDDIASDANKWRLLQAEEILLRFHDAHGRPCKTISELERWVVMQSCEKPVLPREELHQPFRSCAPQARLSSSRIVEARRG